MSTARSPTHDRLAFPPDHRPYRPADDHRLGHADGERAPSHPEGLAQPGGHGGHSDHGADPAARERQWRGGRRRHRSRLSPGIMGRALRRRPGRRPAVDDDGGPDQRAGRLRPDLRPGALGPRRAAFPCPVPAADHGRQRRPVDRRPVQPVRLLRSDAGRLLRPGPARFGRGQGAGGRDLHRRQPDRLPAVPDRGQPDLWSDGHAEHGGPGDQGSDHCGG